LGDTPFPLKQLAQLSNLSKFFSYC